MSKTEWRMMYEAPSDKPVLIWVAPVRLSPALTTPARFVVDAVFKTDPRSGERTTKYPVTCRWTQLPAPPRQRVKGAL